MAARDHRRMTARRLITLDDAPALAELVRVNRTFLAPWEPLRDENYFSEAGQRADIERALERHNQGNALPSVILDQAGAVVGRITLNGIVRGAFQSCSVGYWVSAAAGAAVWPRPPCVRPSLSPSVSSGCTGSRRKHCWTMSRRNGSWTGPASSASAWHPPSSRSRDDGRTASCISSSTPAGSECGRLVPQADLTRSPRPVDREQDVAIGDTANASSAVAVIGPAPASRWTPARGRARTGRRLGAALVARSRPRLLGQVRACLPWSISASAPVPGLRERVSACTGTTVSKATG